MSVNVAIDKFTFVKDASWRFTSSNSDRVRLAFVACKVSLVFWIFIDVKDIA